MPGDNALLVNLKNVLIPAFPNSGLDSCDWAQKRIEEKEIHYTNVEVYDERVIIDDPNLNVQKCEIESI